MYKVCKFPSLYGTPKYFKYALSAYLYAYWLAVWYYASKEIMIWKDEEHIRTM